MNRVLIVDDKEENLYYLRALLSGHGWEVDSAHHGAEALVMARRSRPDLVVSDLLMPVMDGYTLLRHWKLDASLKRVPFVVYTATYTEAEDERLAISLGADCFILKPSDPDDFLSRLERVMSNSEESDSHEVRKPIDDETELLRVYSETLIRKLEEKSLQLELTNRALQDDVTRSREMESSLRASQMMMATAQRIAHFGSWALELEGADEVDSNRLIWSDEMYRIAGYEPGTFEVSSEKFFDLVPPDDRPRIREAVAFSIRERRPYSIIHRMVRPNGEVRIVQETAEVFVDDSTGRAVKMVGTAHDITERHEAAEALAKSEREQRALAHELEIERSRLLAAQEVAKLGSWETDIVSLAVNWSRETYRIFERAPGEFRPSHLNFIQLVHPDDRQEVEASFMASLGRSEVNELQHRIVTPDGRVKYVVERWQVFHDKSGTPVRALGTCRDITERVIADRDLRHTSTLLQAVVEGTTDAVFVKDRQGRYMLFNRAASEFVGRSIAEVLGKDDRAIFGPEDARVIIEGDRKVMETGETFTAEEVLTAAGVTRTYSAIKAPFRDARGNIIGTIGVSRDITESKLTETALRDSIGEISALGAALDEHAIVSRTDASGRITYVNDKFCAVSGYSRDELIGQDHRLINSGYHPKEFFVNLWARITSGKVWQGELRNRAKDGSYYWVDTTIVPFCDKSGSPYQYISIRTDVTKRKQTEVSLRESESRFRRTASQLSNVLDYSLDVICSIDEEGCFVQINAACETVWGYGVEELLGKKYIEKVVPEDRALTGETAAAIMDGHSTRSFENRYQRKDGSIAFMQWAAHWSGAERILFCVARDITEKKSLESQFLRAQRMESIGTLAGGIAHDLNNVLAPIMMSIDLLKMDDNDPLRAEILSTIEVSAKRGADMVQQVLSFARGVEGRQLEVQMTHLLKEIQKISNETFLKSIHVKVNIERDIWVVEGDPTQLHQVMLNLSVNARDAMPEGGTLTLSAKNLMLDEQYSSMNLESRPGPHVVVEVEDTGSGMPPEVIDRIFEPFYTTKELGKGTGLGLSTTLAIIKSHGGFVRVYSEVGKGTTFRIYLPAKLKNTAALVERVKSPLPVGHGELILVVDDEAAIREITRQTLETSGYRVLLASDGAEAIATYAMRSDEIAAVLTDMMMPTMDGSTAIHAITRINPSAIVLAASGLSTLGMEAKAVNAGVKYFIPKPYTAETLLRTLARALSTSDGDAEAS